MTDAYIIFGEYFENGNFLSVPMFVCYLQFEADLFVSALNKREPPFWSKVIKWFGGDSLVPSDIVFSVKTHEVLSFIHHHNNP